MKTQVELTFVTDHCWQCGIIFQLPKEFMESRKKDGRTYFCPNGHEGCHSDAEEADYGKCSNCGAAFRVDAANCEYCGSLKP